MKSVFSSSAGGASKFDVTRALLGEIFLRGQWTWLVSAWIVSAVLIWREESDEVFSLILTNPGSRLRRGVLPLVLSMVVVVCWPASC